jgi:hypothetical protein
VLPALAAGLAPCSPILLRVERLARQPWLGPGSAIAMTAGLLAFAIAAVWAPPSY